MVSALIRACSKNRRRTAREKDLPKKVRGTKSKILPLFLVIIVTEIYYPLKNQLKQICHLSDVRNKLNEPELLKLFWMKKINPNHPAECGILKRKDLKEVREWEYRQKKYRLAFPLFPVQGPSEKQTAVTGVMGWSPELVTSSVVATPSRRIQRLKCHFLRGQSHLCWFNTREQTHSNYLHSGGMSSVACDIQSLGDVWTPETNSTTPPENEISHKEWRMLNTSIIKH